MICPKCGSEKMSVVLESRWNRKKQAVQRRRECAICGCRFITLERVDRIYERQPRKHG